MTRERPPHDIREATDCHCVPRHRCDCIEARVHAAELTALFNLRWKADMRAIKRWQEAHPGNELVWPDHADMVVWLLEQLDDADNFRCHRAADRLLAASVTLRADAERLREALGEIKRFAEAHHGDEQPHIWLHGLTVDIPALVLRVRLTAERLARGLLSRCPARHPRRTGAGFVSDQLVVGLARMARERWAGEFHVELQRWAKQSGIEMLGTEGIEADFLAEIAAAVLCRPQVLTDAVSYLADYANAGKVPPTLRHPFQEPGS